MCDFVRERTAPSLPMGEHIHCIWYCVATEEGRSVSALEKRFFGGDLASVAPHVPALLVFTKYDEFVSRVQLTWSRDAEERGLSKVAVSHILKDLTSKKFEETIGKRWDDVMLDSKGRSRVQRTARVCVAGCATVDDDDSSFGELAAATLKSLGEWKEWHVKLAFAAAQRNSAAMSTRCMFVPFSWASLMLTASQMPPTRLPSTLVSTRVTPARSAASRYATSCPTSSPRPCGSST